MAEHSPELQSQDLQNPDSQNNPPAEQRTSKKKKPCRRWLFRISAVFFLLIFVLLITLLTGKGQRALVRLSDRLLDSLSIQQVSGDLQSGLLLQGLNFNTEGVNVDLANARLQLDLSCLLQAKVCLQDLTIQQPKIQIDSSKLPASELEPESNQPMQHIKLPIAVLVENVAVQELQLDIDQDQLSLANFHTSLSLNNETGLNIQPTLIDQFRFIQHSSSADSANKKAEPAKPVEATAPMDWQALEQRLAQPMLGEITKIDLPFDMHIQGIEGKNWQYQQWQDKQQSLQIDVPSVQLKADATGYDVQLQQLEIESNLGKVQGQGKIQLEQDFPLDFSFKADLQDIKQNQELLLPASQLALDLNGSLRQQTSLKLHSQGAVNADLQGQVQLNQGKTPFHLQLQAKQGHYPFTGKPAEQIHWSDVSLDLGGDLLAYQADLQGKIEGMGVPKTALQLQAKGGIQQAQIENLSLQALDGSASLQGDLNWSNGVAWNAKLLADKLNLSAYVPQAQLSGELQSSGFANAQDWQVLLPQLNLNGKISGQPLSLQGELVMNQKTLLKTPALLLNYGKNQIQAKGELSDNSDFNLHIDAPNLAGLVPNLSASLKGDVALQGKITAPNVKLELSGSQIKYEDLQLQKLYAKADLSTDQQVKGRVDLSLDQFAYGEIKISQGKLWANGSEQKHELHLRAQGEPVAAVMNLYGGFDRNKQQWQGILNQTEIKSPIGSLKNSQNVQIQYNNQQLETQVSAHCWNNPDLELCFPQSFKAGVEGEIPFAIKRLNLALVNKLIEQDSLSGQLQAQGKVAWFKDKPFALNLQLDGNNLAFNQKINYRNFKLSVPQLSLKTEIANNNLSLLSAIKVEQGNINSDIKIQDLAKARQLGGSLNIQGLNLNIANQLLARGENLSGNVQANLKLGGNLEAPLLHGNFDISQIKTKLKAMPFELDDGALKINFQGNSSSLNGYLQTDEGRLNLDGDANWKNLERWQTRLHAKADNFRLEVPNMAKLKLSPDVELRANPDLLELSGNVDIPWARIAVESLPESAVSVSSDEVIIDKKTPALLPSKRPATSAEGMQIKSDLKINIGDDVSLDAYGLKTNLNGLLSVKQEKGNLGLFGQVNLKNGRYASFGQDLLIRKGQISFSGMPSQPFLNIEAIRNPEAMEDASVVAGVKVIGAAEAPEVKIFSEPSLPQDQALSYILTGRSLENSGDAGSSGSIGAALLGLGLSKSGKLVGGIGETFGISDLNLGTSGVGDSSQVVVSGNITPRLQVKYGVGLFEPLAELTLRYRLLPRLYLQSVSGANQAFDLLYQFEF